MDTVTTARVVVMGLGFAALRRPGTTERASKFQPELHLGLMALEMGQVE